MTDYEITLAAFIAKYLAGELFEVFKTSDKVYGKSYVSIVPPNPPDNYWALNPGGDMLKSVYDIDEDGLVGDSEKLEGSTKVQVQDHVPQAHTLGSHSSKAHTELTSVSADQHGDTKVNTKVVDEANIGDGKTLLYRTASGKLEYEIPSGGGLGYTLAVLALTASPLDGAINYFGNMPKAPVTGAANSKIYIRKAGTIKIAEIYTYSPTAGSAEAWSMYVRLNNTTDTLIATLSVSANERVFSNTGLSIPVAVGNYIEIKIVNPTWATNPVSTCWGGYIYIE